MRVGLGDMQKAQSDPSGTYYTAVSDAAAGKPPSRQQTEELVVATAVLAGAAPEVLAAIVAVAALVEGLAWLGDTLGIGSQFCDHPPIDENDVRWLHFENWQVGWPNGVTSGPFANPNPGSFEAFVLPILKRNWELAVNCRAFVDYRAILDAASVAWNASHAGPTDTIDSSAFQLPDNVTSPATESYKWPMAPRVVSASWPPVVAFYQDHSISINRGAMTTQPHLPPIRIGEPTPTSTAAKVATGAAVIGGGAVAATLIYSWVTGKAVSAVLEGLWKGVKKAAHAK